MKKRLSIVILNHNTKDLLRQCLESINGPYEIIVVDNASTDGSIEMLKQVQHDNLKVIFSKENLGFSKGNNLAREKVSGEYVLFLNSDTKFSPGTLETMIDFMDSDPKIGISTCKVLLPNGNLYYACHRGFPTPLNSLLYFLGLPSSYYPKYQNDIHEIDACSGTFLLIRKNLLDKINWFDEDYFAYGEDLEMCYRVKELGYKVMFNPMVKILHYWGASSGLKSTSKNLIAIDEGNKNKWNNARYEAMKIFYDKHYRQKYSELFRKLVFWGIELASYLRKGRD